MKFELMVDLVLASSSPRRHALLSQLEIPFKTEKSEVPETVHEELIPTDFVQKLAIQKAEDVYFRHKDSLILGADTIVAFEGEVLHKPVDRQQAKRYLQRLSGNTHQVHTGVAFIDRNGVTSFVSTVNVTFKEIQEELIDAYIDSGDPFDKAGGYGIQTLGGLFVQSIEGDYNTVVGLPLTKVFDFLYQNGKIRVKGGGNHPA